MSNTIQWNRTHLPNGAVSYDAARGAYTYIVREDDGNVALYILRSGSVIHRSNHFWCVEDAMKRADMFA